MRKSLEEFSKESRALFDTRKINGQVWTRVARELKQGNRNRTLLSPIYFKWAAAAAVFLFIAGAIYFSNNNKASEGLSGEHLIREQYPEYDHRIQSFTKMIDDKKTALTAIEHEQPGIYSRFIRDVTGLKQSYEAMEKELLLNPNKNTLLTEMIENLELQDRLLNRQLELIKEFKESFKRSNEKNIENI